MSRYEWISAVGKKVYLSIALFYKNGWIKLYNIFVCIWDVSIKGRRACNLSLFRSLPCFGSTWCCISTSWEILCSKQHVEWPETHVERQEMPRIHPGDVSLQVLGLHDQEQTKDSCKAKLFVITVLFTQTGKSSKESRLNSSFYLIVSTSRMPFPNTSLPWWFVTRLPGSHCQPKTLISICVNSVSTLPWLCYYSCK